MRFGGFRHGGWFALAIMFLIPNGRADPPQPFGNRPAAEQGEASSSTNGLIAFGLVMVDPRKRTVSFPARINMTNAIVEYAVVTGYGKTHESLVVTEARATDLQAALLLLSLKPSGPQVPGQETLEVPPESGVRIDLVWHQDQSEYVRPLEDVILMTTDGGERVTGVMAPGPWLFNGSGLSPEGFVAHFEGSLISLIWDPGAIINNPRLDRADDEIHLPHAGRLPGPPTPVTVRIQAARTGETAGPAGGSAPR
jgi:hypothetical protein